MTVRGKVKFWNRVAPLFKFQVHEWDGFDVFLNDRSWAVGSLKLLVFAEV